MSPDPAGATDFLRDLPLSAASPEPGADLGSVPLEANAHIHLPPNFSAFPGVAEAVRLAAAEGVRVLGASNYYDFRVYAPFAAACRAAGIFPLFGLEAIAMLEPLREAGVRINDPGNPGKMYLCGKGIVAFDEPAPDAREILRRIRAADDARMAEMARAVEARFAEAGVPTGLDAETIRGGVVRSSGAPPESVTLQERHLAAAFQEALFGLVPEASRGDVLAAVLGGPDAVPGDAADAVAVQGAIRSRLMKAGRPAFVPERFVAFDEARRLVLALGGIPCYPVLADGADPVCPFEADPDALGEALLARGIGMCELIPHRNTPAQLGRYARTLRGKGLAVVGGTEHNTTDRLPLAPRGPGGSALDPEVAALFREGASVVAAHQALRARGADGFVDESGAPAGAFDSADARIRHFAETGRAVLAAFFDTTDAGDTPESGQP
jgi:hypothetical protein